VAHYPGFEEKEVRNVKKLPAGLWSYFLTLNTIFFKGLFAYQWRKKGCPPVVGKVQLSRTSNSGKLSEQVVKRSF